MKFLKKEEEHIILYQNKFQIDAINFEEYDDLEDQFRILFRKLKDIYHFEIEGYYDIDIYYDENSGRIIEIEKEPIEYFEYLDNQVDMKIILHEKSPFLYQVEDVFTFPPQIKRKIKVITYQGKTFLHTYLPLTNFEQGALLEFSTIYYKNVDSILKRGICS